MALPSSGPISFVDICGVDGLNISFNSPPRELHELANMAIIGSTPYNNRFNPSIFDWYGYVSIIPDLQLTTSKTSYNDGIINITGGQPYEIVYIKIVTSSFNGSWTDTIFSGPSFSSPTIDTGNIIGTGSIGLSVTGSVLGSYNINPSTFSTVANGTIEVIGRSSGTQTSAEVANWYTVEQWTITAYVDPNLYFVRNYGTSSVVTVQTSTNNGVTWSDNTGTATSPRNIGSLSSGTWIRLESVFDGSHSNTIVVGSTTEIMSSQVAIFNTAKPTYSEVKTSTYADSITTIGNQHIGNAFTGTTYETGRLLIIFNTSVVTSTPTAGTLSIYITANPVTNSLTFRTITPNVTFSPFQSLTVNDWDDWNGSTDSSGVSEGSVSIPANSTGYFTFDLSSAQLSSINTNNEFSVYVVSNGDYSNSAPSSNSRPFFSTQGGLGISGIGDYKLTLSY